MVRVETMVMMKEPSELREAGRGAGGDAVGVGVGVGVRVGVGGKRNGEQRHEMVVRIARVK